MADLSSTTSSPLGSIKLSFSQRLSDKKLAELEKTIKQAGLDDHETRRYICENSGRLDHVVEVIARYENLSSEEWRDLCDKVLETHYHPVDSGCVIYQMWKSLLDSV